MQPFISTADLEAYMELDAGDLTGSNMAIIALDSACEIVRGYISQTVNLVEDDVVLFNGNGRPRLILPEMPVVNVTAVTEDTTELTPDDDWYVDRAGILHRKTAYEVWPVGVGNIEVTYTHGWAAIEADVDEENGICRVPSDIRRVALGIARRVYTSTGAESGGIVQETMGSYSYTQDNSSSSSGGDGGDLLDGERVVLDRYRVGSGSL